MGLEDIAAGRMLVWSGQYCASWHETTVRSILELCCGKRMQQLLVLSICSSTLSHLTPLTGEMVSIFISCTSA
jgi:hypothetical protein